MDHRMAPRRSWLCLALVLATLCGLLLPRSSQADSDTAMPWHPVAAAYLRALFYANLGPQIDWDLIAAEYNTPIEEAGYNHLSSLDLLAQADSENAGSNADAIRLAIAGHDRQALFAASTRAVAGLIRYYIGTAEAHLTEPGAGLVDVIEAQRVFRAFRDPFMEQADPIMVMTLDEAWQEMMSSVGSTPPDAQRFGAARAAIEAYLANNYEVATFSARTQLAPVPERVADAEIGIWLPPGSTMAEQDPLPRLRLNFEARGFEESNIPLVAYGDMLFDSPQIFGEPARTLGVACSTCHNRSDINNAFFIPGVSHQAGSVDVDGAFFNPLFNDQRSDSIDIPSLRGIRFTAPYGRDGRFDSLRDFTRNVIVNEFGGAEPTPFVLDALLAYMLEFDWQSNSLLNKDGTLNENASPAAHRGEMLFNRPFAEMGGKSCSSCHIPGSSFIDGQGHDIGSDSPSEPFALDDFFDTPTLLNSAYSAPYFHDGSLATLGDVVDWFNDNFHLGFSSADRADLTEYLVAVGSADSPYQEFDDENTEFLLNWTELTTFCTTLESKLIPQRDAHHAILLLDTVVPDFREDAGELKDKNYAALVYRVADKLDEIKIAIQAGDWAKATALYDEYEELVYQYGPKLR